jgi:uncharacterized protein
MSTTLSQPRIESVDTLRGAALFFILISNIPYQDGLSASDHWLAGWDTYTYALWSVLVSRKFITIFSVLFGFGFYVLLERAKRDGTGFRKYFGIRMLILFAIGSIHGLLWFGDILRAYALCGFLMMWISHWPTKRLLVTGLVLSILVTGVIFIGNSSFGWQQYSYDYRLALEHPVTTSFPHYLWINFTIDPWVNFLADMPITLSFCMGNIVLGFLLGRTGFFQESVSMFSNRFLWISLLVGLICSIAFFLINKGYIELSLAFIWLPFVIIAGMMLQSLAYMGFLLKWIRKLPHHAILGSLRSIGRMPLSNYLFQTFWYHLLFFHALAPWPLYGKLGMTATFFLAIILFSIQMLVSNWWMSNHRQGPVEYVWRRLLPGQNPAELTNNHRKEIAPEVRQG